MDALAKTRPAAANGQAANPLASSGCREQDWGLLDYAVALHRQRELAHRRRAGQCSDTIVRVSHPRTVTLGRNAPARDLLVDARQLREAGVSVQRSDRGGRATWHDPGQAVVYPVVSLSARRLGVARWVSMLESTVLELLQSRGVQGRRRSGHPGIWTDRGKVASLGLRVSRGVSYHGVAVNAGLDVSGFDVIVTCGVEAERVTSLAALTGEVIDPSEVSRQLSAAIVRRLCELDPYEES